MMPSERDTADGDVVGKAVLRKVTIRLLPFLFLLYVINLVDRTNIGIARLQMVDGNLPVLSEQAYALGAGLFYIGYLLFEVPSNIILLRVGARVWMARIVITWGIISALMMLATGPVSFGFLRVMLGFAEAGFFPGIIFYMSQWFPVRVRARAVAIFMTGGVIASLLGNPISGLILEYLDGRAGLWGWQWMFLLEGIPAVVLGLVTLQYLTDHPHQAHWLTVPERTWLIDELKREETADAPHRSHSLVAVFTEPRVWLLIAIYFSVAVGDNVYSLYVPSFLKSQFREWSPSQIGFLTVVPSLFALLAMTLVSRHSDKKGERRWHMAASAFTAGLGWLTLAFAPSPLIFVAGLIITLAGMKSLLPIFWTVPTTFLAGTAAAGGVAFINSMGNLGGFVGPVIVGQLKAADGSFFSGLVLMAGIMIMGSGLSLLVRSNSGADRRE